jgi:hypothetical protein
MQIRSSVSASQNVREEAVDENTVKAFFASKHFLLYLIYLRKYVERGLQLANDFIILICMHCSHRSNRWSIKSTDF